jgi:hypothetical protein
MKNLISGLTLMMSAASCTNSNKIGDNVYTQSAISIKEALKEYQNTGKSNFTVFGRVKEVCQAEGCWFSYDLQDRNLVVDFNDKFTVPTEIAKKDLYAVGRFYQDTLWADNTKDSGQASFSLETKFLAQGVQFK